TAMLPGTQGNNKVRFAFTDNSTIREAAFDPAKLPTGSTWQDVSAVYTAGKDGQMLFGVMTALSAGEIYFDDVYVIDITDRVDLDATAGTVSNLQSTVTQQGKDI
ncbi:hypothetical protein, partial [Serratia marcescens]